MTVSIETAPTVPHHETRPFTKTVEEWENVHDVVQLLNDQEIHIKAGDNDPVLGDIVNGEDHVSYPTMKDAFMDPDSVILMLYNTNDQSLMGYTFAFPMAKFNPTDANPQKAYIYVTALKKEYQGLKLVKDLIDPLFVELEKRGYRTAARDPMVDNGYADKVTKVFDGAIITSYDHNKYGLGQQRYLEVDIKKYNERHVSDVL